MKSHNPARDDAFELEMKLCGVCESEDPNAAIPADRFISQLDNKELGTFGEVIAASFAESIGLRVIERNYRCEAGEADLIAEDEAKGALVFIEVKTRRVRGNADPDRFPEEAVDCKKLQRYRRIAACYTSEHEVLLPVRFDAVGIFIIDGERAEVAHLMDILDWETGKR